MAQDFYFPVRVYIEDTDIGGVVYYANYLKFLERARTEFFRSKGYELRQSFSHGTSYVVHSLEIVYKSSALLDEELKVLVKVLEVGKTFLRFEQNILRSDGSVVVEASVKVACVSLKNGKPKKLDEQLLNCLV